VVLPRATDEAINRQRINGNRRAAMRVLPILLTGVVGAGLALAQNAAGGAGDEAAIRGVVQKYLDAREHRDPQAVAALFTEDADQLVSNGQWRKGRDELVKGTLGSSETNPGKRTLTVETIRFVAPGVAVADARYEIVNPNGDATRKMWSTFLMTHSDRWRIAAIRNMLPAPQNR
jgi:uncharacterized protein (TIGR02246 family)